MKYLTILFFVVLSTGCSFGFGGPSKATVLEIYREMHQPIESIEDLDCSKVGYGLPSEKEWPIYECIVKVKFESQAGFGSDKASFIYQDHWNLQYSHAIEKLRAQGKF